MPTPVKPLSAFPLFTPPPPRWGGAIIDAHMHAKDVESMRAYWAIAELYGITHAVVIADLDVSRELRREFGERVEPAVWGLRPRQLDLSDWSKFQSERERLLENIAADGFKIVKLWFTPRFYEMYHLRMDDPRLDFFFKRIEKLGLAVLVHVADPDYWFAHRIDAKVHGTKLDQYPQLLTRLQRHPDVIFQAAHFGGHPEDLDHLHELLARHPNLFLDSSATKWVAREFSRQGEQARNFLIAHADRVLFGTDLVADPDREKEGKREHYATRFYVHRHMWEQQGEFDSPIEDEDSPEKPRFRGLHLPADVLAKVYWQNAARLYGFTSPQAARG